MNRRDWEGRCSASVVEPDTHLRNVEIALGKVDRRLLILERILLPPREPTE